jgi:hypothetical protein
MNITRGSPKSKAGPEIRNLEDGTGWWSVSVDGYVTYCGPEIECRKRLAILVQPATREMQDQRLAEAIFR